MTRTKTPRIYDEDYKKRAVGMVLDGRGANRVAGELDIPRSCLQRWKKRHLQGMDLGAPAGGMGASELAADNELALVSEQRDILKKAIRMFGEEGPSARRR